MIIGIKLGPSVLRYANRLGLAFQDVFLDYSSHGGSRYRSLEQVYIPIVEADLELAETAEVKIVNSLVRLVSARYLSQWLSDRHFNESKLWVSIELLLDHEVVIEPVERFRDALGISPGSSLYAFYQLAMSVAAIIHDDPDALLRIDEIMNLRFDNAVDPQRIHQAMSDARIALVQASRSQNEKNIAIINRWVGI
jgi:hypothetical protein